jgi:hypothetical protein
MEECSTDIETEAARPEALSEQIGIKKTDKAEALERVILCHSR